VTPAQEEAIADIGGEPLLEHTRLLVRMARVLPHAYFPPKETMERGRRRLLKALSKVGPELRLLLRTLHALNAKHYGFGAPLPEAFDVVAYLEALAAVQYVVPKGDPLRHEVILLTKLKFAELGVPLERSRSGDLHEYLGILTELLGQSWDVWQLTREVVG